MTRHNSIDRQKRMRKQWWAVALWLCIAFFLNVTVVHAETTTLSISATMDNRIIDDSGGCAVCLTRNYGANNAVLVGRDDSGTVYRTLLFFSWTDIANERALPLINATLYMTVGGRSSAFVGCNSASTLTNPSIGLYRMCNDAHNYYRMGGGGGIDW